MGEERKKNVPNAEEIPLGWVDLTIYKNISDVCFVKPQALACLLYEFNGSIDVGTLAERRAQVDWGF